MNVSVRDVAMSDHERTWLSLCMCVDEICAPSCTLRAARCRQSKNLRASPQACACVAVCAIVCAGCEYYTLRMRTLGGHVARTICVCVCVCLCVCVYRYV